MKKKLLLLLPIIPLAASCGGSDPMAEVSKNLPSDEKVVPVQTEEEKEAYIEIIDTAFDDLLNPDDLDQVHTLSVDLSVSTSGQGFSGSGHIKGDLSIGFMQQYNETLEETFYGAYIEVEDFSVSEQVSFAPEMQIPVPTSMSFSDVDASLVLMELPTGTVALLDGSDHDFQNAVHDVLASTGMPEEDQVDPEEPGVVVLGIQSYMDMFLGEKLDGAEYRPGYALIDVNDLISDIGTAIGEPAPEELANSPIKYFVNMLVEEFADLNATIVSYVETVAGMLTPTVGIKVDEEELVVKTSVVLNVSTYSLAAQFGFDESILPVHGYAGLLVSAGTEHGSSIPCIEEVQLSANLSGAVEGVSFALVGSVSLESYYCEQALDKYITVDPTIEYLDITAAAFALIQNYLPVGE